MALSEGQCTALDQLRRIADTDRSPVRVIGIERTGDPGAWLKVHITLDCTRHEKVEGGLPLHDREGITLWIPPEFPFDPPLAFTAHTRFLGFGPCPLGALVVPLCLPPRPNGTLPRGFSDSLRNSTSGYDAAPVTNWIIRKDPCIPLSPTPAPRHPFA